MLPGLNLRKEKVNFMFCYDCLASLMLLIFGFCPLRCVFFAPLDQGQRKRGKHNWVTVLCEPWSLTFLLNAHDTFWKTQKQKFFHQNLKTLIERSHLDNCSPEFAKVEIVILYIVLIIACHHLEPS